MSARLGKNVTQSNWNGEVNIFLYLCRGILEAPSCAGETINMLHVVWWLEEIEHARLNILLTLLDFHNTENG